MQGRLRSAIVVWAIVGMAWLGLPDEAAAAPATAECELAASTLHVDFQSTPALRLSRVGDRVAVHDGDGALVCDGGPLGDLDEIEVRGGLGPQRLEVDLSGGGLVGRRTPVDGCDAEELGVLIDLAPGAQPDAEDRVVLTAADGDHHLSFIDDVVSMADDGCAASRIRGASHVDVELTGGGSHTVDLFFDEVVPPVSIDLDVGPPWAESRGFVRMVDMRTRASNVTFEPTVVDGGSWRVPVHRVGMVSLWTGGGGTELTFPDNLPYLAQAERFPGAEHRADDRAIAVLPRTGEYQVVAGNGEDFASVGTATRPMANLRVEALELRLGEGDDTVTVLPGTSVPNVDVVGGGGENRLEVSCPRDTPADRPAGTERLEMTGDTLVRSLELPDGQTQTQRVGHRGVAQVSACVARDDNTVRVAPAPGRTFDVTAHRGHTDIAVDHNPSDPDGPEAVVQVAGPDRAGATASLRLRDRRDGGVAYRLAGGALLTDGLRIDVSTVRGAPSVGALAVEAEEVAGLTVALPTTTPWSIPRPDRTRVVGTPEDDEIVVDGNELSWPPAHGVAANAHHRLRLPQGTGTLEVFAGEGNDHIAVSGATRFPVHVEGEAGSDTLTVLGGGTGLLVEPDEIVAGSTTITRGSVERTEMVDAAPIVRRTSGAGRISTAVALSQEGYPEGTETIVLSRADAYPDALAGAPLAASLDAPVLLTGSNALAAEVVEEIARLGATRIVLLGGESALDASVEDALREMDMEVARIAGRDRFDTARRIAEHLPSRRAYVVEGANADPQRGWPDALSVSGVAARTGDPILLVTEGSIPPATADALEERAISAVTVVGGRAAVSDEVVEELRLRSSGRDRGVRRVSGKDRYATAAALADHAMGRGLDVETVWLSSGGNWPDGLVAGPLAAVQEGLVLLVAPGDLAASGATQAWLREHRPDDIRLAGGTAAVSRATAVGVRDAR